MNEGDRKAGASAGVAVLRRELARRRSWFCVRGGQNTGLNLNRSRLAPVAWVRRRLYFCDTLLMPANRVLFF